MSYANYGPDLRVQTVANLAVAPPAGNLQPIAQVALGAPATVTALIKTAAGGLLLLNEIPLVLGAGTWAITAFVALNMVNAAAQYELIQADLVQNASTVASCVLACGADILNGNNVELEGSVSYIATIAAPTSFYWRLRVTGNTEDIVITGGSPNIKATKLSE